MHPLHFRMFPPTATTFLLLGVSWLLLIPRLERCWGPARQIPAPLSGKIRASTVGSFFLFFRIGVMLQRISWIDIDDMVVKHSSTRWTWATRVSSSSTSRISAAGFFRHRLAKWLEIPQLCHFWSQCRATNWTIAVGVSWGTTPRTFALLSLTSDWAF